MKRKAKEKNKDCRWVVICSTDISKQSAGITDDTIYVAEKMDQAREETQKEKADTASIKEIIDLKAQYPKASFWQLKSELETEMLSWTPRIPTIFKTLDRDRYQ